MAKFVHLHNHSHFSLLDGACRIDDLISTALEYDMPAVALTDHGNMFGAIDFYQKAKKKGIKPLVGSEVYVAPKSRFDKRVESSTRTSYHLVLLCKNETGYKNLLRLVSLGYLEGFYYKPRIDKELLRQHSEGLIALSACLQGEIQSRFLKEGYEKARSTLEEYYSIFGDDFYLEVQNHGIPEEDQVRVGVFALAKEMNIKVIATNDIHYLKQRHHEAHDVLLCLQTGKDFDDPSRMRYTSHQLYFKSPDEMAKLFADTPEVLENTLEVAEKCNLELNFDEYHLPYFQIPAEEKEATTLEKYLEKLVRQGMAERYDEITPELEARLQKELGIINQMGYPGYFLITYDFINYARSQNIPVGPGRGSAAGSLVAYCLYITNLDPMRYNLIFERFLNPERVSMPDIDIDFCYERREEVIDYVKEKYGKNNVCQIITFGTMAARGVIRDVGRVLKMSYGEVDKISKLVPAQLNIKLDEAINTVPELKELESKDDQHRRLIEYSRVLEGTPRHASTHAAGVVITPEELTNYVPLYKTKDDDVTTQWDMKCLEGVGVLKMDFLGLRTLTVIQKTIDTLRKRGIDLDIDHIPLDDKKVYELFSNGDTIGLFQFESTGMQEYLKKLKPECLEDLIAMNALYRPGPMDFIDDFINGKKDKSKVKYPHPLLEPILKETNGIAVYQEQVMKIASDVGGFTLGGADMLRRAMGKKKIEIMIQQRAIFTKGAKEKGVPEKTANEIFDLMEKFAGYGFNKSHAACYSLVAYQTGYLKAHYPAEFLASSISSEMNSSNRVTILLEEARKMDIQVLPPDVNESFADFVVTNEGIRFGLGAVKNVGRGSIEAIVAARDEFGNFKTIYDLCQNVDLKAINKKVLESLVEAGAMDSLEGNRAQQYALVEKAIEFAHGAQAQRANGQTTIFDLADEEIEIAPPPLPQLDDWSQSEILNREKNILGFYLSGHPLERYREEVLVFSTVTLDDVSEMKDNTQVRACGIISEFKKHFDRQNRPMGFFKLEDFSGNIEGLAFSDCYEKYGEYIEADSMVMVIGKINTREGEAPKLLAEEVLPLNDARERFTRTLCVAFDIKNYNDKLADEVKDALEQHAGNVPVYLSVKTENNDDFILKCKTLKVNPTYKLLDMLRKKVGRENVWVGA